MCRESEPKKHKVSGRDLWSDKIVPLDPIGFLSKQSTPVRDRLLLWHKFWAAQSVSSSIGLEDESARCNHPATSRSQEYGQMKQEDTGSICGW